ncbi:hypothetical protein RB594_006442 [Gaeumannomyces avenae]
MSVSLMQEYDDNVRQLQREVERRRNEGGYTSDSLTEPPSGSDEHAELRRLGMIWTGCYTFSCQLLPSNPGPGLHACFNFDPENRAFYVAGTSNSQHAVLTVNGTAVARRLHALNQHNTNIRFDKLEYVFRYTSYAATDGFTAERADYQTRTMNCLQLIDFEMPTPQVSTRIIGPWTLANPLGRGGMGRMCLASNTNNDMVAVKTMERNPRNAGSVDRELQAFAAVTALAKEHDEEGRIVLHAHGYLHGDLKPPNIGLLGTPPRPVLLDTGGAERLELGFTLKPTPGHGGTIGYIAPEREMEEYDHSVDIWSLGVIGYELTYGHHPWKLACNPWHDDVKKSEDLRPAFHKKYQDAMDRLARDFQAATSTSMPSQRFLHLGLLLQQMLRFPWAHGRRIPSTRLSNTKLGDRCCLRSPKSKGPPESTATCPARCKVKVTMMCGTAARGYSDDGK